MVYIVDETHYILEVMLISVGGVLNLLVGIMSWIIISKEHRAHKNSLIVAITSTACGVAMIVDVVFKVKK